MCVLFCIAELIWLACFACGHAMRSLAERRVEQVGSNGEPLYHNAIDAIKGSRQNIASSPRGMLLYQQVWWGRPPKMFHRVVSLSTISIACSSHVARGRGGDDFRAGQNALVLMYRTRGPSQQSPPTLRPLPPCPTALFNLVPLCLPTPTHTMTPTFPSAKLNSPPPSDVGSSRYGHSGRAHPALRRGLRS